MNCRSCGAADLASVLDLGEQHLADFRDDNQRPPRYPLHLLFCERCGLAQLDSTVPRELMYHDRYGFKSGVNDTIRADHRAIVTGALRRHPGAESWLDIACNDGTLLSLVPKPVWREGIDPVAKYADEARVHAQRVVNDYFHPRHFTGKYDVVTSVSMFYDIDDPNDFCAQVESLLASGGVWVVQQNYLGDTLTLNAVDNICHEHIAYWSLYALEKLLHRHGLEVFDVQFSNVNGGCIRTYIGKTGQHPVENVVAEQIQWEMLNIGLNTVMPFEAFADRVWQRLNTLRAVVDDANDRGEKVAVYGASTRGGTLWQAADLGPDDFAYAVDRNPEKVGKTMSSIGIPIISEAEARDDRPDLMVASIWFFRDEIVHRERDYLAAGGKLVFPLPDLEVVVR